MIIEGLKVYLGDLILRHRCNVFDKGKPLINLIMMTELGVNQV
jgi:hypothetical protein